MGVSSSKSNYAGTDVTQIESTLAAGGTTSIVTPGALTIDGSSVSGGKVVVDAGSLAIASRQDTSTFSARSKSTSLSASVSLAGDVSVSGNFASGKQNGSFASVTEQAGIHAGSGGFDMTVAGNTDLKGAVIASEAEAASNRLVTGTLTASDIENTERWKASQISLGGGIGANIGGDRQGQASSTGASPLPGLGPVTVAPPIALSAGGSQSGVTTSAIAPGTITITSGDEASQSLAATISRDTAGANAGSLSQAFTEAKREEVAQGFQAAQILATETSVFFARKAQQAALAKKEAETGYRLDNTGQPLLDDQGNPIPLSPSEREQAAQTASQLTADWGAGSPARLIATAVNGAAGANVTGSLTSLVQASAVNVLQGLATQQVKQIADSLGSEEARAALQAVVGCTGSAAGGSGDCTSAATGAAASVVLNNLLKSGITSATDENGKPLTLAAQQARDNLVATLTGAIAAGAGLDAGAAVTAAHIEATNNALCTASGCTQPAVYSPQNPLLTLAMPGSALRSAIDAAKQDGESDEEFEQRYSAYANGAASDKNITDDRALDAVAAAYIAADKQVAQAGSEIVVTGNLSSMPPDSSWGLQIDGVSQAQIDAYLCANTSMGCAIQRGNAAIDAAWQSPTGQTIAGIGNRVGDFYSDYVAAPFDWVGGKATDGIVLLDKGYNDARDRIDASTAGMSYDYVTQSLLFQADFGEAALSTMAKGFAAAPSAIVHPIDSAKSFADTLAIGVDTVLVNENTPAIDQIAAGWDYLKSGQLTSRQIATDLGKIGGTVATFVIADGVASRIGGIGRVGEVAGAADATAYTRSVTAEALDALSPKGIASDTEIVLGGGVGDIANPTLGTANSLLTDAEAASVLAKVAPSLTDQLATGRTFLEAPELSIPYGFPINLQGEALETALAQTGQIGTQLDYGAKTFDFLDRTTGLATSAKTIDTLTDAKLADPNQVYNTAKNAIDAAIQYVPRSNYSADIPLRQITAKQVVIAIPAATTEAQMQALVKAIDYGQLNGIAVKIVTTGK